jgi:hypothetical protein
MEYFSGYLPNSEVILKSDRSEYKIVQIAIEYVPRGGQGIRIIDPLPVAGEVVVLVAASEAAVVSAPVLVLVLVPVPVPVLVPVEAAAVWATPLWRARRRRTRRRYCRGT